MDNSISYTVIDIIPVKKMSRAITVSFSKYNSTATKNPQILDNTNKFSGSKDFFLFYFWHKLLVLLKYETIVSVFISLCFYYLVSQHRV